MVRSPSGVTRMMLVAVGAPIAGVLRKLTPSDVMSWRKILPKASSATFPKYAPRPPSEATPAMVLPALPPEVSTAGPTSA